MGVKYMKLAGILLISIFIFASCSDSSRLSTALEQHVEKENGRYPIRIDEYTSLDSCVFIKPSTLQYRYTLSGVGKDVDTVEIKNLLKTELVGQMKIESASNYFRSNNVMFQYRYNDTNREYLFRIDIDSKDYKK